MGQQRLGGMGSGKDQEAMFSLRWDGWSMGQYGVEFSSEGGGEDGGSWFDLASGRLHVCPFPPSGATKSCYSISAESCDFPEFFFLLPETQRFVFMSHPD